MMYEEKGRVTRHEKHEPSSAIINTSLESKEIDEQAIVEIFADKDILQIFTLISESPRTGTDFKILTKIPSTSLYRKLTWLLEKGLVRGIQTRDERKNHRRILFYPVIKRAVVTWEEGKMKVETELEIEQ